MKILKNNWKTILLILLIVFSFVFYYEILPRHNQKIALVGYNLGMEQTISQLFQLAPQCQPIPLTYNNQTIKFIAVGCLNG